MPGGALKRFPIAQRPLSVLAFNASPAPDGAGNNKAAGTFVDSRLTSCAGGCICFGHCAGEFFVLGVPGGDGRGGMHAILAV